MTGPTPPSSSDQFGPDAVQSLAPLVVNVLENLDNALGESENNDRELVELNEKYKLLEQQYEKERQRRREAEEVCVCVLCVHAYICRLCQCWHERVRTCTYVRIHTYEYGDTMWLHCCYKAHNSVCTDVCKNIRLYVRMFVPCTYMHLLYTSLRSHRASLGGPGKPKKAIQLVH